MHDDDDPPIYRRIADEMLVDPDPPMDAQSRAFREMTGDDVVLDRDLGRHADRVHPPIVSPMQLLQREDWERRQWDAGRTDPRPGPG